MGGTSARMQFARDAGPVSACRVVLPEPFDPGGARHCRRSVLFLLELHQGIQVEGQCLDGLADLA